MAAALRWLSVGMHVQEALRAFLLQLEADGRSAHTIGQYRRHGTSLANWLTATATSTNIAKLTPDILARFFADDAAKNSCPAVRRRRSA